MMIDTALIGIATGLVRGWRKGGRRIRTAITASFLSLSLAALVALGTDYDLIYRPLGGILVGLLAIPAALVVLFTSLYVRDEERSAQQDQINDAENRFRASPEKPAVAWEVARLNLQSYIDRNLSQVSWIFGLILLVMFGGFAIICLGIWESWNQPENLKPSIVAAGSGIVIQFIGATFLVIYKSTTEQARAYVSMLERINAVGMSAQLLESIQDTAVDLRDQARIDLAKSLLSLYGQETTAKVKRKHAA